MARQQVRSVPIYSSNCAAIFYFFDWEYKADEEERDVAG